MQKAAQALTYFNCRMLTSGLHVPAPAWEPISIAHRALGGVLPQFQPN
jgi:hypothetical protein